MKKFTLLIVLISLGLLLVACGGSSGESEPASAESNIPKETAPPVAEIEETEVPATEASTEEVVEEEETAVEESSADVDEVEEATVEPPSNGFGDLPLTGTDTETGLVINPTDINPGETILIRGEIISMNLTPTTSPEYLIQVADGVNFRFRGQDLKDTYFIDGTQLKPFQYQLGMLAQASITLAADAGPTDLATTKDLTLISMGE